MRQADGAIEGAVARKNAVRGQLLPGVTVDGNVMVWNQEVAMSFLSSSSSTPVDLSAIPAPQTVYETILFEMLKQMGGKTVVQEQVTWQVGVTAAQPLTPIWAIVHSHKLAGLGVDLAMLKKSETLANTLFSVVSAYYQVLQVEAVQRTLSESLGRMKDHLDKARLLRQAELVAPADVLKIEVALARVEQTELSMRNMAELARTNLAVQVGWGPGRTVRPTVPELPAPRLPPVSLEEAFAAAEAHRPELAQVRNAMEQVRLVKRILVQEFVPSVSALANYTHAEGSSFRDEDSMFVGLAFSWPVWQWGASAYKMDEANANLRQAQAAYDQARDFVLLEVKKHYLDVLSAMEELRVAQRVIDEAEENYRMQKLLFEAEYKTSSDLIDAESSLTQARSQYFIVQWKTWLAWAGLQKAMGAPVKAWFQAEVVP
jgi:outer membrane protein TolC